MFKVLKVIYHPVRILSVLPIFIVLWFISEGASIGAIIGMIILGVLDYSVYKNKIRGLESWIGEKDLSAKAFINSLLLSAPLIILFDVAFIFVLYITSKEDLAMVDFFVECFRVILICNLGGVVWAHVGVKRETKA